MVDFGSLGSSSQFGRVGSLSFGLTDKNDPLVEWNGQTRDFGLVNDFEMAQEKPWLIKN